MIVNDLPLSRNPTEDQAGRAATRDLALLGVRIDPADQDRIRCQHLNVQLFKTEFIPASPRRKIRRVKIPDRRAALQEDIRKRERGILGVEGQEAAQIAGVPGRGCLLEFGGDLGGDLRGGRHRWAGRLSGTASQAQSRQADDSGEASASSSR